MLSRRRYRRHKPCSRQPCVLTVDFESESRSTWFSRLCFFYNFFFFTLGEEVAKGCVKDTLPSRLSSRICPPPRPLLCPFSSQPNVTSWLRLPASGPCVGIVTTFFDWDESGQSSRSLAERGRETEGSEADRERRDSGGIVGLNFGQLFYREGQRDFLDGGVLMARC